MGRCSSCKLKRLSLSKKDTKCQIAKYWCPENNRLIGDGTYWQMQAAEGCTKWQKINEIKEWNGK